MRSKYFILLTLIFSFVALTAGASVSPIGSGTETPTIPDRPGFKDAGTRGVVNVPGNYATIQAAIDNALVGDEIVIAAGTHIEAGQITVNKDLTIKGDVGGGTTVLPGIDTGLDSSCDPSRAFIYVPLGFTVTISDLTIDGGANIVGCAIHSKGDLTVENCTIRNFAPALYNGRAVGLTDGTGMIRNCTFENIGRIGVHVRGGCSGSTPPTATIEHCTYTGKGAIDCLDYAVEFGGGGTGSVCNSTFTNCLGLASDGSTSAGILITTYFGPGTSATLRGNVLTGNTHAIAAGYDGADTSYVDASFNDFSGCVAGIMTTATTITADLEKNWWGTTNATAIAGLAAGPAAMDYDPWLLTPKIRMAFKGNRLVDLQNDDGGWDWPLDDGNPSNASPLNTVGPIAMGLAKAYRATGDPDMLPALANAGSLLLTKTTNFSPSDGYLAPELDALLGGSAYSDHVWANFYTPMANGTYDYKDEGTLYDTADYVQKIRDSRASQGIPNLAAWDVAMGLVGAASSGVGSSDLDDWIAGVKAEIDELDGADYYDVIGLAGAVYALAFVGEDYDPTAGEHETASSLADLADILATYQIAETGGFAWNRDYVIPYDFNETAQETAYAILALAEAGGHSSEVAAANDWLLDTQLCTGGTYDYWGENNEVTGEGGWAIWASGPAEITLVPDSDCYSASDTVTVSLWMNDVADDVVGGQFFLEYDDSVLTFNGPTGAVGEAPFQNLYLIYATSGELDYAVQIPPQGSITGTAKIATLTFTATSDICSMSGLITWRGHVPPTRLSGPQGQPIYPDLKAMDVIDDEAPDITCPAGVTVECFVDVPAVNTGAVLTSDNCDPAPVVTWEGDVSDGMSCPETITRTYRATDHCGNWAECTQIIIVDDNTDPGIYPTSIAACYADEASAETAALAATTGDDNCTAVGNLIWDVDTVGDCSAAITVTVTDECGNSASTTYNTTIDNTDPVISDCPANISVNADAGDCDAIVSWDEPTAADNCGMASFTSTHSPGFTFPSGPTTVTYTAVDNCGNTSTCSFTVTVSGYNEMVVSLELMGVHNSPTTRCITFVLWDCTGPSSQEVTDEFTFTGTASPYTPWTATQTVLIPCGSYTCVTARDKLHTLRRTLDTPDFDVVGTQYVADFVTAGKDLEGGNLNDDDWVDILDYGIFSWQYGGSGLGDTNCSSAYPHADIDGDGIVDSDDFSFIQTNFLHTHDADCCSGPSPLGGSQPVISVSVHDLIARGLHQLAAGDLNNDGWLDQEDIVAFMHGARPAQMGIGWVNKPLKQNNQ